MRLDAARFIRKNGLRKASDVLNGRIRSTTNLVYPKASIVHYWPETLSLAGPSTQEPFLEEVATSFIHHVTSLSTTEGRPMPTGIQQGTLLNNYRRDHRRYKPIMRDRALSANRLNMLVVNYAPLNLLYRYTPSFKTEFNRWYNEATTFVEQVNDLGKRFPEWTQFITIDVPDEIPTKAQLNAFKNVINKETLSHIQGYSGLFISEFWKWLGKETSVFDRLTDDGLRGLNIFFKKEGQFMLIPMHSMKEWLSDKDPVTNKPRKAPLEPSFAARQFLKLLESVNELQDIEDDQPPVTLDVKNVVTEAPDFDIDFDSVFEGPTTVTTAKKIEVPEVDYEPEILEALEEAKKDPLVNGIETVAADLLKNKAISKASYERAVADSLSFKEIADPWGGTASLEDLRTVTPEDMVIPERVVVKDKPTLFDKSLREVTVLDVQKKYVKDVLPKDIVNSVLSVQKQGVAVKDYKIEQKVDAVNAYEIHRVTLKPVKGRRSTVEFRVPLFDDQNRFVSNGNKCIMRTQRIDLPIRKTKPTRVVCSSYYGKIFVERVVRKTADYSDWLARSLKLRGLDSNDTSITHLELNSVFKSEWHLPITFTAIGHEIGRFNARVQGVEYTFEFDYGKREDFYTEAQLALTSPERIPLAHAGDQMLLLDRSDVIHAGNAKTGSVAPVGRLVDVLGLDENRAPIPYVEMKVLDKTMPVGFALAFDGGLEKLLADLGCTVKRHSRGERVQLAPHEYRLTFDDETLVLSRLDVRATLIVGGLVSFNKTLRQFSVKDFESKDVYYRVLEEKSMGSRYLRELENIYLAWMDDITTGLLKDMGEPTTMHGLLIRAGELLLDDYSPAPTAPEYMRYRGPERVAGIIYQELNRAVKQFNNSNGSDGIIQLNPISVWQKITQDPAVLICEEANPIQCLREQEGMTYRGFGGRPDRAMTAASRVFQEGDRGVVSESTVDSGAVGVINFLSPNANFSNVRGLTREFNNETDGNSSLFSSSMLLAPLADQDDRCTNTRSTGLVIDQMNAL